MIFNHEIKIIAFVFLKGHSGYSLENRLKGYKQGRKETATMILGKDEGS